MFCIPQIKFCHYSTGWNVSDSPSNMWPSPCHWMIDFVAVSGMKDLRKWDERKNCWHLAVSWMILWSTSTACCTVAADWPWQRDAPTAPTWSHRPCELMIELKLIGIVHLRSAREACSCPTGRQSLTVFVFAVVCVCTSLSVVPCGRGRRST
jgi:hypothetical protein